MQKKLERVLLQVIIAASSHPMHSLSTTSLSYSHPTIELGELLRLIISLEYKSCALATPSLGKEESEREAEATKIYRREFGTVFVLEEFFRQDSEGEFFQFLCRLKKGECTVEDVEKLRGRLHVNLSEQERAKFEEGLAVFPTRDLAHDNNM